MSIQEFENLLRNYLKQIDCKLRKDSGKTNTNSYTITTPREDIFWMYWYDLPHIVLSARPGGRPYCKETRVYEHAINMEIYNCTKQWISSTQHSVYDTESSQRIN